MKLTKLERKVIETYKTDDYVGDFGWDHELASAWTSILAENCEVKGKQFSGVVSSLVQKGIMQSDGYDSEATISLTTKGIKIVKTLS